MAKKYIYTFLIVLLSLTTSVYAQDGKSGKKQEQPVIEGLTIYPNPTNTGKIYVTSKSNLEKKVEIFDVLGKKVLDTTTSNKEVNVSALSAGVYIIKIREAESTATRKLIIN